jgi:hypothetical protein
MVFGSFWDPYVGLGRRCAAEGLRPSTPLAGGDPLVGATSGGATRWGSAPVPRPIRLPSLIEDPYGNCPRSSFAERSRVYTLRTALYGDQTVRHAKTLRPRGSSPNTSRGHRALAVRPSEATPPTGRSATHGSRIGPGDWGQRPQRVAPPLVAPTRGSPLASGVEGRSPSAAQRRAKSDALTWRHPQR